MGSWSSCNSWFVLAAAALLVPALSGCTLLKDEEPFQVTVRSDLTETWMGVLRILDGEGKVVFAKMVTVERHSFRTPFHVGELDGPHTFMVESGGRVWQDTATAAPGDSAWNIAITSPDRICFDYVWDGESGGSVCPEAMEL